MLDTPPKVIRYWRRLNNKIVKKSKGILFGRSQKLLRIIRGKGVHARLTRVIEYPPTNTRFSFEFTRSNPFPHEPSCSSRTYVFVTLALKKNTHISSRLKSKKARTVPEWKKIKIKTLYFPIYLFTKRTLLRYQHRPPVSCKAFLRISL